ncbi:MAG: CoA-binding protein [Magnetococcales bacterium]|nr:CoA-binding protein [Magnetococcales bacterium]MBF0151278.1 CoA-binding protein [Magnetococcales bacterium]MBF0174157.1 CoA-binding protein [Magnetococcales bacterium]MBF0347367.1 CoA-binding protein [Magnetococcales bacterium]MBF0632744.1 CoA-binding protein [Magnetococcales bacterium]
MTAINHEETIRSILKECKTIAVIGLSPKPDRASHRVAAYMQRVGYRIIPIRPGSGTILGEPCFATLSDLPAGLRIDLVDVFRRAEETLPIAREAVAIGARGFWLQSGIINDEAMAITAAAGLWSVQDHCLMVEHRRLANLL